VSTYAIFPREAKNNNKESNQNYVGGTFHVSTFQNLLLPIVSFSGPFGDQIDCSNGWKSLKQNPSFLEGRSIT